MPLAPAARFGSYEIVGLVGTGGMGEVYRARDMRLNRDVAIKVLSDAFANDQDRLARFEREAQVLAALNHARIATIHGLEEASGVRALVMELVEGPTLAERLAQGPLGIAETLALAKGMAEGLEYAHERGIVHRDLKPANVKVTPDGSVKILDFGLAKALDAPIAAAHIANSPTISVAGTQAGLLLGTAAYMAPEQARGHAVDRRADIWAFGCVLYEMLTGGQAFPGATLTDVLAAIVSREPDWDRLPAETPSRLGSLLRRCLRKDPRERLRDIGDARFEIEDIQQAPQSGASATGKAPAYSGWLKPALAGVVVGAVGVGAMLGLRRSTAPVETPPTRLHVELPAKNTLSLGRGSALALSPDGTTLVFVASGGGAPQLFARALDRFDSTQLPGTEGATNPFFSPDGKWVGFFAGGRLKKVALSGGQPVTVAEAPNARGESWSADDYIYFTPTSGSAVWRVSATGGNPQEITKRQKGELSHRWPHVLPDSKTLLFAVWNDTGFETGQVVAQSLTTGERRTLVTGGSYPRFLPAGNGTSGYLIYARASGLLAAPFDAARVQLTGSPVPILDGVVTNLSGGAHVSFSPSGSLTYVAGGLAEAARVVAVVDRSGAAQTLATIKGMSLYYQVSPDGKRLVRSNPAGPDRDIWIHDLERDTATRLTYGDNSSRPIWTPDGKRIAFSAGLPDANLFWKAADGTGSDERLTTSPNTQFAGAFSPDGKQLVYVEYSPTTAPDIWVLSTDGNRTTRPFLQTPFVENEVALSPDGRWLAYQSNESGRFEIYVQRFPSGGRKLQISTDGGGVPQWSRNGREIFYRNQNRMMVVAVREPADSASDLQIEKPRVLFEGGYEPVFSLTPDERFVMIRNVREEFAPASVNVVLRWIDELRRALK